MPTLPRDCKEKSPATTRADFDAICEAIHREAMDELIAKGLVKPPMVTFDRRNLTIEVRNHDDRHVYEIDLERCTTPAMLLDWIFQLHNKSWMTAELMYELLTTFEEACQEVFGDSVQGCFCPFGVSRSVDWKNEIGGNR
jgi:hypothetical protein